MKSKLFLYLIIPVILPLLITCQITRNDIYRLVSTPSIPDIEVVGFPNQTGYYDFEFTEVYTTSSALFKIKNTGTGEATNVDWTITVTGGIFNLVNEETSDTITSIDPDEEVPIETDLFFGLGPITITIEAQCSEGSIDQKDAGGTILIFWVLITTDE